MGAVDKETYAKRLPAGAKIIVRKGERLAQGQDPNSANERCR